MREDDRALTHQWGHLRWAAAMGDVQTTASLPLGAGLALLLLLLIHVYRTSVLVQALTPACNAAVVVMQGDGWATAARCWILV